MPGEPNRRTAFCRLVCCAVIALGILQARGQELFYLALQRPGQASVAIDSRKQAAYITDLGKIGDGDTITIDGKPLLDFLAAKQVRRLVFTCSHPHSDHMGGIVALFRNPRQFFEDPQMTRPRFAAITVIDDSAKNTLFEILSKSVPAHSSLSIARENAGNRNAFTTLSTDTDQVFIENIPYEAHTSGGAHGRAVVTHLVLGGKNPDVALQPFNTATVRSAAGAVNQSIVDFDDADSIAIARVVQQLKTRGITHIDTFIVPHHGSGYHDIAPILELTPGTAIIAVNPQNQYGHPSPSILSALIKALGRNNVLFTGSENNIVLTPDGIDHTLSAAATYDSYERFVQPNRLRAEKKGALSSQDRVDYEFIEHEMLKDVSWQDEAIETAKVIRVKMKASHTFLSEWESLPDEIGFKIRHRGQSSEELALWRLSEAVELIDKTAQSAPSFLPADFRAGKLEAWGRNVPLYRSELKQKITDYSNEHPGREMPDRGKISTDIERIMQRVTETERGRSIR